MAINVGIVISAINNAAGGINSAKRDVDGLGTSLRRVAQVMRAVQALFLVNQVAAWGKAFVKAAADLQSTQIRLAAVTGSFEKANAIFAKLNQKFGPAGLDVGVLADGFTRLAAAGLDLEKSERTVNALANAVAAFGGDSQQLERAVIGISQVVGKGTLQMEELRQQIGEAVPVAMRIMADAAGVSTGEFVQQVSKGMIDAQRAVDLFIQGSEKAFGDFSQLLGLTLTGSLGRIQAEFSAGLANLMANTNIDEGMVAIFNRIADAIKDFMAAIDQSRVDQFWQVLEALVATFDAAYVALQPLISLLGQFASSVVGLLNALPPEIVGGLGLVGIAWFGRGGSAGAVAIVALVAQALQLMSSMGGLASTIASGINNALPLGLVGLAFLGKKGAAIFTIALGVFDGLATYFRSEIAWLLSWFDAEAAKAWERQVARSNSVIGALAARIGQLNNAGGGAAGDSLFSIKVKGNSAHADEVVLKGQQALNYIMNKNAEIAGKIKIPEPNLKSFNAASGAMERFAEKAARVRKDLADTIQTVGNDLSKIGFELANDKLGAALQDINNKFDGTNQKLTDAILKATQLNKKTGEEGATIAKLNELLAKSDGLRAASLEKEKMMYDLSQKKLLIEEQLTQMKLQQQISDLRIAADTSFAGNFLGGTEGGQLALDVMRQRQEMEMAMAETARQLLDAKLALVEAEGPLMQEAIQGTIFKLQELQAAQSMALQSMTVEAQAQKDLWQDIGSSISQSVGGALNDLMNGTFNAKKALQSLWNSVIESINKYIMKLIEAQIQQMILNALGGGGGGAGTVGGFLGGLFANGGAFKGSITPFADGGVVRGPTMFGLMGEKGDEAIMPLTRIGGKLGVMSTGGNGGGDTYKITVQAIDTQSGLQFIHKHLNDIQQGMTHRKYLNRGMRNEV